MPFLLLLVNAAQELERLHLVARTLRQPHEKLFGPVQQAGAEVVLGQREQGLVTLLGCQVRTRNNVLVNTDGAIHFTPASKQITQRKVRFDGLVIDTNHLEKVLQGLVRLLIQQEVQALEVIDIQRWWRILVIALAESTQCPAGRSEQQEQAGQQKGRFSRHRTAADF